MLRCQQNARRGLTTSRCRFCSSAQQDGHYEEEGEEDGGNLVPCNEIIALCKKRSLDRAVELMQQCSSLLPPATYWSLLKLCNEKRSLYHAKYVHAHMAMQHMAPTITSLNEYAVLTFCKCGDLASALVLFYSLPLRTVFSWTAVISGYMDYGDGVWALQMYASMLEECVIPNEYTYVSLLKSCGSIPNMQMGKAIHACAWSSGVHLSAVFASSLVSMYSKWGAVDEAEKAFLAAPRHDVESWTLMISVFIEHELIEKAMVAYRTMQNQGVTSNEWTISTCLQGCYILIDNKKREGEPSIMPLEIGRELHKDAVLRGLEGQAFICSSLVRVYGKCGCITEAEHIFCSLPTHDVVSWTAMLSSYVEQDEAEKALKALRQMVKNCTSSDKLAISIALQACCLLATQDKTSSNGHYPLRVLALGIGQGLYADIKRKGFLLDAIFGNTLANLFVKCGRYAEAETVLADLGLLRDVVSWMVMLPAFIEQGQAKKALQSYQQMQKEGVNLDGQIMANILKACRKLTSKESEDIAEEVPVAQVALEIGRALHNDALEKGFTQDMGVGTELVSLYGKHGSIVEAEYCFKTLLQPDAIAHFALLSAYARVGHRNKALQLYLHIITQGVKVGDAINGCMLQSCIISRSLRGCRQMQHSILWSANGSVSLGLATRLIFAYASCGSALDALVILNTLSTPDVVTWNALMSGCIQMGDYAGAFERLEEMKVAGIEPNQGTFICLLSACCQAGLAQKGVEYFESMRGVHGLAPRIEHYGCMIDLLGRDGDFDKIEELVSTMQVQPDLAMWLGLLGACQIHGNVELGRYSYERAISLQPRQAAAYVLMSNIFTNAGMQDRASEVDLSRERASAWKKPGQSWIYITDTLHTFVVKESLASREKGFAHDLQEKLSIGSQEQGVARFLQQKQFAWRQEGYIPQIAYQSS